ncbi:MAG: 3-isopropylmalate dehydrogenase [Clostridia bacterium]|nr:3-isopropylmalate dehydrogenase [Clostridia bacterium]
MTYNITVLDGDGIGPEICEGAVTVLRAVGKKFGHEFIITHMPIGGRAIDEEGTPLPEKTLKSCLASDSVLLGAVGGPKWDNLSGDARPEAGLLAIRKEMGLFTNIRPAKLWKNLAETSPLKSELVKGGVEITIVRELTGGIYFGRREKGFDEEGREFASDTEKYTREEIERVAKVACELAMKKKKKIISVDKANVLESSRLWRRVVHEYVSENFPEIDVEDMFIDNCAMQIVKNPARFDVVLTSNIFGDILSDEAAEVTGSIGMLASSSLGETKRGLYEPIHGSAPDIAGKDEANPIATILAAGMMLRDSFSLTAEHAAIEAAVQKVLDDGYRTADIMSEGMKKIGCKKMYGLIAHNIER